MSNKFEKELSGRGNRFEAEMVRRNSPVTEFGSQFSRGLTDILNLPREKRALGVSEQFPEGVISAPPFVDPAEHDPETAAGRAGRFSGVATGLAPSAGAPASMVPRASNFIRREVGDRVLLDAPNAIQSARNFGQNFINSIGNLFKKSPGGFTAVESLAGAGAGATGFVAGQIFPDSDAAIFIGDVIGGTAPAMLPFTLTGQAVKGVRNFVMKPFSDTGSRQRAMGRFDRAIPDKESALQALESPTTAGALTPAQQTGDIGALTLERAVMESSDELRRQADEQIANANRLIQESAQSIGGEVNAEVAQEYLRDLMNTRLRIAAQKTDERIEQLGKGASREQANRIAAEEVENALQAARTQEEQLYKAINPDLPVVNLSARDTLQQHIADLGKAQQSDIPIQAKRLLNPDSQAYLGDTTNIREMRALQSKLREEGRIARSNNQFNKARIADDIADAITDDISNTSADEAVDVAVAFSRDMSERFRRGAVGKMLGFDRQGGRTYAGSLSLENTIAGGGPKARESFDQIVKALDNPDLSDAGGFRQAARDYVSNQFISRASRDGQFNARNGASFIRQNDELLSRMPELRQELEGIVRSGRLTDAFRQRITDPKMSKAALFIQRSPDRAFQEILSEGPTTAVRDTRSLINMARKDQTGEALKGLKSGFVEHLFSGAREGARDITGERFVSGFKIRDLVENPTTRRVITELFDPAEQRRLNIIVKDLVNLEKSRGVQSAVEGVIGDVPGTMVGRLAAIVGAAFGRQASGAAGVGGTVQIPGMTANMARDLASKGLKDPAVQFIKDAIQDKDLFTDVLRQGIEKGKLTPQATRRLNAWLAASLHERGGAANLEEQEQTGLP